MGLEHKIKISKELFEKVMQDACYSGALCKQLKINYSRMNEEDVRKIRTYLKTIYEIKENNSND